MHFNLKGKHILYTTIIYIIIVLVQTLLNSNEIVMRSLPDEMGAVALAAKLCGYDWSYVLTESGFYYGFGMTPILIPCFLLFDNPLALYQGLLFCGVLLRSASVYVVGYIYINESKKPNMVMFTVLSVLSVMATPSRATNIDNEPLLIFWGWIIVLILYRLLVNEEKKKTYVLSGILAIISSIALLSHTRAIIYFFSVLLVSIIYHIKKKRRLVSYSVLIFIFMIGYMINKFLISLVQNCLYNNEDFYRGTGLVNTSADLVNRVNDEIVKIFTSEQTFKAMYTLLVSNIWISIVFSCGIIIFGIALTVYKTFTCDDNIIWISLFASVVIAVSVAGLLFLWNESIIAVNNGLADLSRGHFYLRYYGVTFGIVVFATLFEMYENCDKKIVYNMFYFILFVTSYSIKFIFLEQLSVAFENNRYGADWFGYFAPYALGYSSNYRGGKQTAEYFLIPTIIVILLLFVFVRYAERKTVYVGLMIVMIYYYIFSVSKWDNYMTHQENFFGAVNGLCSLLEKDKNIFGDYENIYYLNDQFGPQFNVQLVLYDKRVYYNKDVDSAGEYVVIVSDLKNKNFTNGTIFMIDNNEYIITNSDSLIGKLDAIGITEIE